MSGFLSSFYVAGVGYAAAVMSFWLNAYYIVVLAWALFYIYASLAPDLPWRTCDNPWNTQNCRSEYEPQNCTYDCLPPNVVRSPVKEYWE